MVLQNLNEKKNKLSAPEIISLGSIQLNKDLFVYLIYLIV